jgi:hypothetical protein
MADTKRDEPSSMAGQKRISLHPIRLLRLSPTRRRDSAIDYQAPAWSHDDSLGDLLMLNLADEAKVNLQRLIGLKLSRIARAADMRTLQFGNTVARSGGIVGEYALHIQCPWRLDGPTGVLTASGDLYEPCGENDEVSNSFDWEKDDSLQDVILRNLVKGYDESTKQLVNSTNLLTVGGVETDSAGGFRLRLSGGYEWLVFPNCTRREAWRLFRPSKDGHEPEEGHFVVPRES